MTFYCIFWTNDSFQFATKLSLMVIIISQGVQWKYWIAVFMVKVTETIENVNCLDGILWSTQLLDGIFWTVQPFVTKLNMVICHHKLECHAVKMGCDLKGHSEGRYNQNMCFHSIIWTNDFLQPNLVWWQIIIGHFATKLSLMVEHHKLKCPVKILECCGEGQGHNRCLKIQLFVWMVSSEPLYFL